MNNNDLNRIFLVSDFRKNSRIRKVNRLILCFQERNIGVQVVRRVVLKEKFYVKRKNQLTHNYRK
jgi:hypothetical protein